MSRKSWQILVLSIILTCSLVVFCACNGSNSNENSLNSAGGSSSSSVEENSSSNTQSSKTENGLTYVLLQDGTYQVTACDKNLTEVIIPLAVDGIAVNSIGEHAFELCDSLVSVVISDSVKTIGDYAFYNCRSLKKVVISNGLESIGDSVFANCPSLQTVMIGGSDNEQVMDDLMAEFNAKLEALEKAESDNAKAIADLTNEYNAKVEALEKTDSDNAKAIADLTNEYNAKVEALEKAGSDNAKAIADLTAEYNAKVELIEKILKDYNVLNWEVTFDSNGGTEVEGQIVQNGSKITRPVEPVRKDYVFDGWFVDDEKWAFSGFVVTENVTLTAKWKYQLEFDFVGGEQIVTKYIGNETEVEIPSEYEGYPVTQISESAFNRCSSLTSVTIPNSVTTIGQGAFSGCSSLESITLPFVGGSRNEIAVNDSTLFGYIFGSLKYAGGNITQQSYLLDNFDTKYVQYYIPSSLKNVTITGVYINAFAFSGCSSLTSVTIGKEVTIIGDYSFAFCSSLTIYCEVKSKPSGWSSSWNYSNCPVVWGEEEVPSNPSIPSVPSVGAVWKDFSALANAEGHGIEFTAVDGIFTITRGKGTVNKGKTVDHGSKAGTTFTGAVQLGKNGSATDKCISFVVPEGYTTLEIYATCGSSGVITTTYTVVVGGINNELSCSNLSIGCNTISVSGGQQVTIYAGSDSSINVWGICIY